MRLSSLLSCSRPRKHQHSTPLSSCTVLHRLYQRPAIQTHMLLHPMFTVLCDKFTETCTEILCIRSIFRRPTSGRVQHARLRKQALSAERGETDVSHVWTNVFFFFREGKAHRGLTAGDGCPTSHRRSEGRQRWSETCLGWNEWDEGKGCQKQM